jgi:hypothetical protein
MLLGQSHLAPSAHRNPGPGWGRPIRRRLEHLPANVFLRQIWVVNTFQDQYKYIYTCVYIYIISWDF